MINGRFGWSIWRFIRKSSSDVGKETVGALESLATISKEKIIIPQLSMYKKTASQVSSSKPITPDAYNELSIRGSGEYAPGKRRPGVLALKKGMLSLYDELGIAHPVTCLQIDKCQMLAKKIIDPVGKKNSLKVVMGKKSREMHVIEVGMGRKSPRQLPIHRLNYFNRLQVPPKRYIRGFHVESDCDIPIGHHFRAAHFVPGQYVDVQAKR